MRDECRGNRKTWRWKHSGVSVKTFSAHVVVVFRLIVSGKRFITHGRVRENRESGDNRGNRRKRGRCGIAGSSLGSYCSMFVILTAN